VGRGGALIEHDPEKWKPVFGKIMLKQKAGAGWRFEEKPSRSGADP
jgi:hypothetical protein